MKRLVLLAILAACVSPLEPPDGAEVVAPLPAYAQWWHEMATCVSVTADMGRVTWYAAPEGFDPGTGYVHQGMWKRPHSIYLAREHLSTEWLVKHEMLHDILQTGDHGHPGFAACDVAARYYLATRVTPNVQPVVKVTVALGDLAKVRFA